MDAALAGELSTGEVRPGEGLPSGATWDGEGTNFSLFSENAEGVELCLFDDDGVESRVSVTERTGFQWHCYLPGIGPGQRYAYRVHGPWDPGAGHRFNPAKLLLDPYAKAIDGLVDWEAANALPYSPSGEDDADLVIDNADDAAAIPKCVIVDDAFDWEEDAPPARPWNETVIYELHVKGFTRRMEALDPGLRGTYAGLASDAATGYLRDLGVTAVELLPVHQFADESFLVERGLSNYWGYSSIGFFAPHSAYSASGTAGEQVAEFKGMVKALHRAGIEVILDVVYNHTAEGNHLGPMLSFKGIDNAVYYRLSDEDARYYMDFTGTGNTLDPTNPSVLRMIMDSLRYWVTECHVDGFRFDLAPTLARTFYEVDRLSSFLDAIHQDPILSRVKLIAEPWDVGPGGYQVGNFPVLWAEWNAEYRDTMRDFWRGEATLASFAQRFAGSSDLYGDGRHPQASINFVTAHDGFTLNDLVSYNDKHNEANLEDNRDGNDANRSWNCGVEGATDDQEIVSLRARQRRNLLATLLLAQGTPMILGGDEIGRSQEGNNNGWCQDNELSWLDWEATDDDLRAFAQRLIELRNREPVFRRRTFLVGDDAQSGTPDVVWLRGDGEPMSEEDWAREDTRAIAVFLNGREIPAATAEGDSHWGSSFLILVNAHHDGVEFVLPAGELGSGWTLELSTASAGVPERADPGEVLAVPARSLQVLRSHGGLTNAVSSRVSRGRDPTARAHCRRSAARVSCGA